MLVLEVLDGPVQRNDSGSNQLGFRGWCVCACTCMRVRGHVCVLVCVCGRDEQGQPLIWGPLECYDKW